MMSPYYLSELHSSRSTAARLATTLAATALVTAGLAAPAAAAPSTYAQVQRSAISQGDHLSDVLGLASGGFYLDHGRAVVNVLDDASARKVEAAGLAAKKVKHSFAALTGVKTALDGVKNVHQATWGIDPRTDQVDVTIYSAADKSTSDTLVAAAAKYGDSVRVERKAGRLELHAAGGDAMWNSYGVGCSLGFNVTDGSTPYILTAGHCTNNDATWSAGDDVTGATAVHGDFPGADSGLLTRPNGTGPGAINTGQAITDAADAVVGEQIHKQGMTSGDTSGEVTEVDTSVSYSEGTIYHVFSTTAVSENGDSGGPAYDGSTGLGTLSGGDGTTSYFYPLTLELQSYGLSLA